MRYFLRYISYYSLYHTFSPFPLFSFCFIALFVVAECLFIPNFRAFLKLLYYGVGNDDDDDGDGGDGDDAMMMMVVMLF